LIWATLAQMLCRVRFPGRHHHLQDPTGPPKNRATRGLIFATNLND